uniref:Uncharacterized protein n=1 Tax=Anguilla anguilla TaxID=7936 RepID=A0A0E9XIX2_ANGAN
MSQRVHLAVIFMPKLWNSKSNTNQIFT